MKTVYIVRHGKTNRGVNDLDRELLPLGIERISKLGKYLFVNNCNVDIFYSSYAKRAVQTANIIAEKIDYQKDEIITSKSLYFTTQEEYFNIIMGLDSDFNSVMIVGHNPEITNVAQFFIPDFTAYMQTGACFCFDFYTDEWTKIFTAERKNRFYVHFQ